MQAASYREIPLHARDGSVRAVTKVSPEDYEWLSRYRWKLTPKGYAQRETSRNGRWTSVRMHRAVMRLEYGDPLEVDHINLDKLDNRRSNLRIVTSAQQSENVPARGGASAHRGVFRSSSGRWFAKVRDVHLGMFETEIEAVAAAKVGRRLLMPNAVD